MGGDVMQAVELNGELSSAITCLENLLNSDKYEEVIKVIRSIKEKNKQIDKNLLENNK